MRKRNRIAGFPVVRDVNRYWLADSIVDRSAAIAAIMAEMAPCNPRVIDIILTLDASSPSMRVYLADGRQVYRESTINGR